MDETSTRRVLKNVVEKVGTNNKLLYYLRFQIINERDELMVMRMIEICKKKMMMMMLIVAIFIALFVTAAIYTTYYIILHYTTMFLVQLKLYYTYYKYIFA